MRAVGRWWFEGVRWSDLSSAASGRSELWRADSGDRGVGRGRGGVGLEEEGAALRVLAAAKVGSACSGGDLVGKKRATSAVNREGGKKEFSFFKKII